MAQSNRPGAPGAADFTFAGALAVGALLIASSPAQAQYAVPPIDEGQAYFMATDGLAAFVGPDRSTGEPGPLDLLAAEAQLEGHESLGIEALEGSTASEHWSQGAGDDSRNPSKVALSAGGVDVLALTSGTIVPDEGIELFVDLMNETNPAGRVLVQSSWAAWDGNGGQGTPDFSNEDHDRADVMMIQDWRDELRAPGGHLQRLRLQLSEINQRLGRPVVFVVPAADAVYRLRQEVVSGRIPGLDRQSELFTDGMGHAAEPVVNLVSYVWFTVMYRQPASGLTALIDADDPTSAERERLLQQIAWEVAAAEPMSGVTAPILWPEGARNMHDLLHGVGEEGMNMEHMEHE